MKQLQINEPTWKSILLNKNNADLWKSMKTKTKMHEHIENHENQWKSLKHYEYQWKSIK